MKTVVKNYLRIGVVLEIRTGLLIIVGIEIPVVECMEYSFDVDDDFYSYVDKRYLLPSKIACLLNDFDGLDHEVFLNAQEE